jgi:hypothetical protein
MMTWLRQVVHRLFNRHRFEPFVQVDVDRNRFARGQRCTVCGLVSDGRE